MPEIVKWQKGIVMIMQYGHRFFNDVNGDVWEDEPEPEPTYICENCGQNINEGDEFYRIENREYCLDCVRYRGEAILRDLGAEKHEINLPVCECCKEEIRGKYFVFRGHKYCNDCVVDYGEDFIREILDAEPETAGEAQRWEPDWAKPECD